MEFKTLKKFIDIEDERLKKHYGNGGGELKHVLARTIKLTEEMGELSGEVLACNFLQRKEKLGRRDENSLAEEFADVIITALLLAKAMDVDIEKSLAKKMDKVDRRYKNAKSRLKR
jgi:NTP pyrophosphatase (non-canonical NTP hydrolase)